MFYQSLLRMRRITFPLIPAFAGIIGNPSRSSRRESGGDGAPRCLCGALLKPETIPKAVLKEALYRPAKRLVASISVSTMPGSLAAWPASGMIRKSASGQRRCISHAVCIGVTTS